MLRLTQFIVGLLLFIAAEVLRVYFIMPFPGSQTSNTIEIAYFLHQNIFYFRTIALLILIVPTVQFYIYGSATAKWYISIAIAIALYIFLMANYKMQADKMFFQPNMKLFTAGKETKIGDRQLVIGVTLNGESKAYPIEIIGYHHQIRDTLGNQPIMVTYCTVCRSGRVYKPIVNGKYENFRLVGMDHFNAMFEDATTGSWWRQANGEVVAGPLKGSKLEEVFSQQATLRSWLDAHPFSQVLAADTTFNDEYEALTNFDEGTTESALEKRDSSSWKDKSWIVGVRINNSARAYDWNDLLKQKVVNDTVGGQSILIAMENDSLTFHVWKSDTLKFSADSEGLSDFNTHSFWNWKGEAVSGPLTGKKLQAVQAYQEFWHSWKSFNSQTTKFNVSNN
jgi:hypothetical protein